MRFIGFTGFGDSVDFGDSGGLEALIGLWF